MPPLDFPPGTPGATYTGPNGVIWSWDGAKWISGTGTTVYAPITDAALLGNPTAPTPAAGDADTSIATTAFVTNAVATSLHDVGRNYLHNSMFNIAQRGAGNWTTAGYTADRWRVTNGAPDTINITLQTMSDGDRAQIGDEAARSRLQFQFTGSAGAGAYSCIIQFIEGVRRLSGKTVTLSFWAVGVSGTTPRLAATALSSYGTGGSPSGAVQVTFGTTPALTSAWTRYSLTVAIPSAAGKTLGTNNDDYTQITIWGSDGANFSVSGLGVQTGIVTFWGVQLELGPTATPLEKLDPVTQLQQCQRFFYAIPHFRLDGYGVAGVSIFNIIYFPVTMRATPSTIVPNISLTTNITAAVLTTATTNSIGYNGNVVANGGFQLGGSATVSADL